MLDPAVGALPRLRVAAVHVLKCQGPQCSSLTKPCLPTRLKTYVRMRSGQARLSRYLC